MGGGGSHNRLKCIDFPKLCLNWGGVSNSWGGGVGNSNSTNYLHIRFECDLECFKFVFECNLECADFRMFTNFSISRKRE